MCGYVTGTAFQEVSHVTKCAFKVILNVMEGASILRKAKYGSVMVNAYQKMFHVIIVAFIMSIHFAEEVVLIGMKCGCAMANVF